jgi:hypothetical protein
MIQDEIGKDLSPCQQRLICHGVDHYDNEIVGEPMPNSKYPRFPPYCTVHLLLRLSGC